LECTKTNQHKTKQEWTNLGGVLVGEAMKKAHGVHGGTACTRPMNGIGRGQLLQMERLLAHGQLYALQRHNLR